MTISQEASFFALATIVLVAFLVALHSLYVRFFIERYRNRMFSIRNELFDRAVAGKGGAFDDDAYKILRLTINGMIRRADWISAWEVLSLRALHMHSRLTSPSFHNLFQEAVCELSPKQRQSYLRTLSAMDRETLRLLRLRSPVVMFLLEQRQKIRALHEQNKKSVKVARRSMLGRVDTEGYNEGLSVAAATG